MYQNKATNIQITKDFLAYRANQSVSRGYSKQKWIEFCEHFIDQGLNLTLYEARETLSKYITIHLKGLEYKVRFSNHRPNRGRESNGDCDFFVGVTNFQVTKTEDAIRAVTNWVGSLSK